MRRNPHSCCPVASGRLRTPAVQFGTVDPLTDEAPDPDAIPDVTVEAQRGPVTYRARFVGMGLVELTATVTGEEGQLTAESVRAAPLGELRHLAVKEIRRRALLLPADVDRDLMLVHRNADGGPETLAEVVMGLAIAEQLSPDRPVDFFAERNGVSRATAYRWKRAAIDAGTLNPQTTELAVSFWRQAKEREAKSK